LFRTDKWAKDDVIESTENQAVPFVENSQLGVFTKVDEDW